MFGATMLHGAARGAVGAMAMTGMRVLTTELAEGVRFAEAETWSQDERNLAAETIFRFVFGSLYRLRLFNGDPHPGNYLFEPGGRVTFLDFGLVTPFSDAQMVYLRALIDTMVPSTESVASASRESRANGRGLGTVIEYSMDSTNRGGSLRPHRGLCDRNRQGFATPVPPTQQS